MKMHITRQMRITDTSQYNNTSSTESEIVPIRHTSCIF